MSRSGKPAPEAGRNEIVAVVSPNSFLYPEPEAATPGRVVAQPPRNVHADDGLDVLTLEELGAEIKSAHHSAERAAESFVEFAIMAGQCLLRARALVPKGEWGRWLDLSCEFSARTAQEYMDVARAFNEGLLDPRRAADSLRNVLFTLRNDRRSKSARDSAAGNRKTRPPDPRFRAWNAARRRFLELTRELHSGLASDDDSPSPEVFWRLVRETIEVLEGIATLEAAQHRVRQSSH